ncbi:nucleoside deaminase [Neobacillus niacini]|uniref:nucleoside deaminase n=1 Tax=Neobacillus niacini TaxID=86668 RepID=UPI0021CB42B7|nr:nucleoside deaminase [Neobacillus niacini]MCM3767690.1 nucleoside deaminase [Neobacillus niacini]
MNWSDIPYMWQECFKEAWSSFQEGSRPIGALITDSEGEIVARGKSATFAELSDSVISHNELAHAEMNALLKLDNRVHQKVNSYVLYTTMEPCPLCFGAFYMSGIRNLEYAAKDKFGGSTNLKDTTPYLSRKPIQINGPIAFLENFSILLNVYFDQMIGFKRGDKVQKLMAEDYPRAVELAGAWFSGQRLKDFQQLEVQGVYEMMLDDLYEG